MKLSHTDSKGRAKMVDVSGKPPTVREAVAQGAVVMKKSTIDLIASGSVPKGDVFAVAKIAGIMAAKKTPDIIPLCHPISVSSIDVDFSVDRKKNAVLVTARAKACGQTGVEMEALTAVASACLTIYDMCKAVDKGMVIGDIVLVSKKGGKNGDFKRHL